IEDRCGSSLEPSHLLDQVRIIEIDTGCQGIQPAAKPLVRDLPTREKCDVLLLRKPFQKTTQFPYQWTKPGWACAIDHLAALLSQAVPFLLDGSSKALHLA